MRKSEFQLKTGFEQTTDGTSVSLANIAQWQTAATKVYMIEQTNHNRSNHATVIPR